MKKKNDKPGTRLITKRKSIWKDKASWHLLLLCIPAIVGYILFNYIPMGVSFLIPFKDYKFAKGILGSDWAGLNNFTWVLKSTGLIRAARNSALYGLWFMVLNPIVNVTVALMLFEVSNRRALKVYQTVFTFPNFMSMVIVGYVTYAILSPRNGFLVHTLAAVGVNMPDVYMNSKPWPAILSIVSEWKGLGMGSMIYFASLMGVDTSLYEAAEIDGAGRFQKMRYISIPHLVPLICIYTILAADDLVQGSFDLFYVIPRDIGLLYDTTDVLNTYIYRALADGGYAMGSAVGLMQSTIGMMLVIFSNWLVKKISPENSMF